MLQIIVHTPVWVWALLAYLLFVGIRALRPATTSLWRMALLPTIFFAWGLSGLYQLHGLRYERVLPWLAALAAGAVVGLLVAANRPIQVDKTRQLVRIGGGPTTLVLILLIFATKYAFGYLHATRPDLFAEPRFWLTEIAVSGLISGMFIGRFAGLLHRYRSAPHQDLPA